MRRTIILVIDSMGIGAMPDAERYGDSPTCNTLGNVAAYNDGLHLPNLGRLGLGNLTAVKGVPPVDWPMASFGRMAELSQGKDTTTGHWEIAGLVLDNPFRVYPNGFPAELMCRFVEQTGCNGYLGNFPASGTEIIERFNDEHVATGRPIIYTSADSVFQIACNLDVVPIETLYRWCEIARALLGDDYNTSRVIARPYRQTASGLERVSALRRDYSVEPVRPTILNKVMDGNGHVIAIGKIEDIFVGSGITHSVHTGSNREGLHYTLQAIKREFDLAGSKRAEACSAPERALVFANLVDTDTLYGHRNDAAGYGRALEEIDRGVGEMLPLLSDHDLLMIIADHGCDPTRPGTDHTRELVPILSYSPKRQPTDLGLKSSFTYVARATADWLGVEPDAGWAN